ncbi:hypothetical protein [Halostella sp. PRR32]|uniref:hypothetical protein n=1 Tax=Halostella sp. PRR32 TaxID=3098147 RepID=UPI002B1E79C9|nr:hypothetical protein [Halostella sp. PRR32]
MSEEASDDAGASEAGGVGGASGADSAERSDVTPESVRDAFVDAAPRTAADVATAVGAPRDAVTDALTSLEAAGDLRRKELGDDDPTTLWYLPAATLRDRETEGIAEADDDIDRALARMTVPGASRMMRDWRRDAVRAVVEHLREGGPAVSDEITENVYPSHSAGYDDPESWWGCVRPRLLSVPGVVHEDGAWRYESDS